MFLKKTKICIVVGHGKSASGGYDSGAVSRDGKYHEFRIARKIAKYASEYLECDLMNYEGNLYLKDRIKAINAANYDFIAEIHLNAGGGTGTETYYYHGSPTGKKTADAVCAEISKAFGITNRGSKIKLGKNGRDYFGIIRDTRPTAILIETVFIDTANDLEKVTSDEGCRLCGEAIAKGLATALEIQKEEKYKVRVICPSLNIRGGAGTKYKPTAYLRNGDTVEIAETDAAGKWGRLADERGWISISEKYVRRI